LIFSTRVRTSLAISLTCQQWKQHQDVQIHTGGRGNGTPTAHPPFLISAQCGLQWGQRRHEGEFPWSGGHPAHNRDQEDQVVLVGLLDIVQVVARCEFEGETLVSHGLHHAVQKTGVVIKTAVKC